jgi:hypothetical protein
VIKYVLLFTLLSLAVNANVTWDSTDKRIEAPTTDQNADFSFRFVNDGKYSVELSEPVASCGCTMAKLDKSVYAPGESGLLRGAFTIKGKHGANLVVITVKGAFLESERRPYEAKLNLSVFVTESLVVKPGIVIWRKGDTPVPKHIKIHIEQAGLSQLKIAKANPELFSAELSELKPDNSYDLIVTPLSTYQAIQGMVTLEATGSDSNSRCFVHLLVR